MSTRPAKQAGYGWLTPYLTVRDSASAMAFYERAFGFKPGMVMPGPDGKPGHVEMTHHDAMFMFGPEGPNHPCKAPASTGVTSPVSLYVYFEDVDAAFARAVEAGATVGFAPTTMFYGDRVAKVTDPDGHVWNLATNVADFDPSKIPS